MSVTLLPSVRSSLNSVPFFEHSHLLLDAFIICDQAHFFAEVRQLKTLFTANPMSAPDHRLLYERHGSGVSGGALKIISRII